MDHVGITREAVRILLARFIAVWPSLRERQELRQEIGESILRRCGHLCEVSDLTRGGDYLIENTQTRQASGYPVGPPSPSEIIGCILAARHDRIRDEPKVYARPPRRFVPFSVWWDSVPVDERDKHAALLALMTAREVVANAV